MHLGSSLCFPITEQILGGLCSRLEPEMIVACPPSVTAYYLLISSALPSFL